jgi:Mn2+/Fe2+ NRAMP family transporter
MYLDAVISMIIYTIVTAAFYLLGAAILHERGEIPAGYDLIIILSNIYTESTGPWALAVFMVGAVVTLFSTLFVACASGTRMFTDAFARCGFLDFQDPVQRGKWIRNLAWILPLIWAILFLVIKAPVLMVMAGGLSLILLLVLVVYTAWYFRYRRLKKDLKPGILYDTLLWISFLAITGVGVLSLYNLF